jgi:hypothetical protein
MPSESPFTGDERIGTRQTAGPRKQMSGGPNGYAEATDSIGQDIPGEAGEAPEGHFPIQGPGDFSQQGVKQPMEAFTPCTWGAQNYQGQVEEGALVMSPGGMALVSVARVCGRCPMEPGCYGMSEEDAEERAIEKAKDMLKPLDAQGMPMGQDQVDDMSDPNGGVTEEAQSGAVDPQGEEQQAAEPDQGQEEGSEKKPESKTKAKGKKKKLDTSPEDEDGTVKKKVKEAGLTKQAAAEALAECGFLPSSISYYIDDLYK